MAISWGAYEGNMRVGIDVDYDSPTNSTTVGATAKYYVQISSGFNFSDSQVLTYTNPSTGGTGKSFFNDFNAGTVHLIATDRFSDNTNYEGTGTSHLTASISGHYAGATPSESTTRNVPARTSGVPDAPGTLGVSNISATSVRITSNAVDGNGSPVTTYRFYYSTSGTYDDGVTPFQDNAGRVMDVVGLAPGTRYYFWVRAYNANGRSGLSPRQTAVTLPVVNVYAAGAWRTAKCWVKAGGTWRPATVWVKAGGTWRKTV